MTSLRIADADPASLQELTARARAAMLQIGLSVEPSVVRLRSAFVSFGVSLNKACVAAYMHAGAPHGFTVQGMIRWWRETEQQPAFFRGAIPNSTVERAWVRRYAEMGLSGIDGELNSVPHPEQT